MNSRYPNCVVCGSRKRSGYDVPYCEGCFPTPTTLDFHPHPTVCSACTHGELGQAEHTCRDPEPSSKRSKTTQFIPISNKNKESKVSILRQMVHAMLDTNEAKEASDELFFTDLKTYVQLCEFRLGKSICVPYDIPQLNSILELQEEEEFYV